jgi:branched-chain amino acid transport system substrate-binding protein
VPTVLVISAAMVASACSGSNTSGGGANTTAAASSSSAAAASTSGASTTAGGSSSSAAGGNTAEGPVIPDNGSGKYGVDPNNPDHYIGPSGFELDLTKCPSDWNNMQGITDTEIQLFSSFPKSGPLAGFALAYDGAYSYFDYVNDNGGIDGRKIVGENNDDQGQVAATKTNSDQALAAQKYAAYFGLLGTPHNLGIWDDTNRECMPHLLTATGAPQWGDVGGHPWTTGAQLDYFTAAQLWAEWLKGKFPNGAKVVSITFNNDFGKSYLAGFRNAIKGTNLELLGDFLHDTTSPNLDNQYTSAAATNADVLLLQTSGPYCTQGMAAVERGSWKPLVIMSETCGSLNQFFQPLIDQGLTGEGTYLLQTFKDVNDSSLANDPFVKLYQDVSTKGGLDYKKTTYFTGWIYGWYMTEILKEAASYKGGLNRANIMLAARAIQQTNPALIPGLSSKLDGTKDAYLSEGAQMVKYTITDPKALGTFVVEGDLVNLEGKLGTYAQVKAASGG